MDSKQLAIKKSLANPQNAYLEKLESIKNKNIMNRNEETSNTNIVGYAIFIIAIFLVIAFIIGFAILRRIWGYMVTFLACLKIFCGRLLDVSIGTIRTIFSVKGKRLVASFLAFFEVLIWYYVARSALNTTLNNILIPISYSLGYATGTYIGTSLSKIIIKGNTSVQIITSHATKENLDLIRRSGYAVTTIDVFDSYDNTKKKLLLMEVQNSSLKKLNELINSIDNKAFITYKETQNIYNGFLK